MSRFSVIDLSRLPALTVIDIPDAELRLSARLDRFKELWTENDPPLGAQYDVEGLEFDPIKITQEAATYFDLLLMDRVNQAARATTLAFASGSDLDALGSRYPGGVPRLEDETDERYRRRILLAAQSFANAGSEQGYIFDALTAEPSLSDASAIMERPTMDDPHVIVTALSERPEMIPTAEELQRVRDAIFQASNKPLTDVVMVREPTIVPVEYAVRYWLFPGMSRTVLEAEITAAVDELIARQRRLGYDHTLNALHDAVHVPGVANAIIDSPAADVFITPREVAKVTSVELEFQGYTE